MQELNIIDAIEESEEITIISNILGDEYESNAEDTELQNTNLTFIEEDFKAASQSRHHSYWMNAQRKINKLEGHEVEFKNVAGEKIVWKVVREVEDDKLISIRDKENALFRTRYCSVHDTASEFSENSFAQSFWALWPGHLDEDVEKLQKVIKNKNKIGRERHARPMRHVTKSEFTILNALMIGSIVFAQSGHNLWKINETQNKVRKKLSSNVDCGEYIKLWRFKELRLVVPKIMEDLP